VLPGTYDDYFGRLKHKKWDDLDDIRDIHVLTTKVPTYKKINGQWVYCYKWGGRVRVRAGGCRADVLSVDHSNQFAGTPLAGR
jgi:hypothetical protein